MISELTYDDLAKYFASVRKFRVCAIPFSGVEYSVIRKRTAPAANPWDITYKPVIKRN